MSIENNECIIASTSDKNALKAAKNWVKMLPSNEERKLIVFVNSHLNGVTTLFMAPCGSRKGWPEDIKYYKVRNKLISFLESFDYADGTESGKVCQEVQRIENYYEIKLTCR
jgi:hypothetical protein